jgi:hypothetical protein
VAQTNGGVSTEEAGRSVEASGSTRFWPPPEPDRHIDMGLPLQIPKYCGLSDRSGVKPLSNMKILVLDAPLDDVPAVPLTAVVVLAATSLLRPGMSMTSRRTNRAIRGAEIPQRRFPRVARPSVPQLPCGTLPLLVRQCKISGRPTALLEE